MEELIDKRTLFNTIFVRDGKVCPNTDIDNFPVTIDVREVKKAILEQPTITEAEIKAKTMSDIFEIMDNAVLNNSLDRECLSFWVGFLQVEIMQKLGLKK